MSLDIDKIKRDSVGRWPGIFRALGINCGDGRHCPCPVCGGKDRFRLTDLEGRGTYICNQHGAGDGFDLVSKVLQTDFKGACEAVGKVIGTAKKNPLTQEKEVDPERLRELFKNSQLVKNNDPVHRYLKERGLKTLPETLRYSSKCYDFETKQNQEAMLAIFSAPDPDGEALTIHRTYIKNGKKLDIKSPKKIMTPKKKMSGGAVRLYGGKPDVMGVCEGIETAIAVHEMYELVVWPCLSYTLLEAFEPPEWVNTVRVYADNDWNCTGQKAAYTLANRLCIKNELRAEVFISKHGDFLDDLNLGIK